MVLARGGPGRRQQSRGGLPKCWCGGGQGVLDAAVPEGRLVASSPALLRRLEVLHRLRPGGPIALESCPSAPVLMRTASRASSVDHYSSVTVRPHDGSFGFVKASFGFSSARWNPHDRFGIIPRPRAMRAVACRASRTPAPCCRRATARRSSFGGSSATSGRGPPPACATRYPSPGGAFIITRPCVFSIEIH